MFGKTSTRLENIEFEIECLNKSLDTLNKRIDSLITTTGTIKDKISCEILATEKFRKEYKEAIAIVGSLKKAFEEQKESPCHGAVEENQQ